MRNAMWVGGGITGMGEIPVLGVKEKGIAKVIRDIFRNGEQGFFYEPSDLKTLYQDSAGTTEVNTSGQPLGIVLDKSKGLVLGPNQISHPNSEELPAIVSMTSGVYTWELNTSAPISGTQDSRLTVTEPSLTAMRPYVSFLCSSPLVPGKFYKFSFRYKVNSGVPRINSVYNGEGSTTIPSNKGVLQGSGTFDVLIGWRDGDQARPYVYFSNESVFDLQINDISVREVKGNHAFQTTSAARPIIQQTPILGNDVTVNGDFSSELSAWISTSGGWIANGGVATSTGSINGLSFLYNNNSLAVGDTAKIVIKIANNGTKGSLGVAFGDGGRDTKSWTVAEMGSLTELSWVAMSTAVSRIYITTRDGWDGSIDKVEIRKVTGYRIDRNYIDYDGVDDKLITNLPAPLTNATVLRSVPGVGTQVRYNQTLPMLYEDATKHSGLIAIDRALTHSEQLRLMRELDKKAGATSLDTLTFKTFDNNQQGFVYDPNDLSMMFQDVDGKTPITTVGQPVGLILDKRKGSATGINLHTTATPINTTIYSATGTRSGLDITVSSEASGYAAASLGIPTVVGKSYLLELIAPDLAGFWVLVSDSERTDDKNRKTAINTASGSRVNTKISLVFTATASVSYIHLNRGSTHTNPVTFKDVSCSEVLGNSAYQATSASRPILRKNAVTGANYLEFDGVDDNLAIGPIPLPVPFSHVMALEARKSFATQALFSGGASGYLLFAGDSSLGVQQNGGNPSMVIQRGKKEVITHISNSAGVTLKSSLTTESRTDIVHANPYMGSTMKYIGAFNDTQFSTISRIDYYGGVFISKTINSVEEEEIRAHFNKRIGT